MQIGFIGLGKLGLPCAEAILKKGHAVSGYDVRLVDPTMVNICKTVKEVVQDKDIVFIAVPTPHDLEYDGRTPTAHLSPKDFNYNIVKECLIEANKYQESIVSSYIHSITRYYSSRIYTTDFKC
jgi:UDPglucose 6-dehydrogenase